MFAAYNPTLVPKNLRALEALAVRHGLSKPQALEYALRNGLTTQAVVEMGGSIDFLWPNGRSRVLRATPIKVQRPKRGLWRWLERAQKLRSAKTVAERPQVKDSPPENPLARQVYDLASVLGFNTTDMSNRIVQIACYVDATLAEGARAFLKDSSGQAVGDEIVYW